MKSLIDYMRVKKLTQTQLAELLGVTQGQVSRWLDDDNPQMPKVTTLKRISERTGIALDKLARDL